MPDTNYQPNLSIDSIPFSHHIFLFPFRWQTSSRKDAGFKERTILKDFADKFEASPNWQGVNDYFNPEYKFEDYNEYTYFYDYVREAMYQLPAELKSNGVEGHDLIRHFGYAPLQGKGKDGFYHITIEGEKEDKTFHLNLTDILVNLYATGAGILSFHLHNTKYKEPEEILKINDFGRRIFPQFLSGDHSGLEAVQGSFLAKEIKLTFPDETLFQETFKAYDGSAEETFGKNSLLSKQPHKLPAHIMGLLPEGIKDHEEEGSFSLFPVLDDRMFVVCWLGDTELSDKVTLTVPSPRYQDFWHKFLFIDNSMKGANYPPFEQALSQKHTYERWKNAGVLFGISRYSFVVLTKRDFYGKDVIATHIRTMYYRMAEFALVQRASVIRFSDEVTHLSYLAEEEDASIASKISELYRAYIRFVNKIYFREITSQEQGIELYDMLQEHMRLEHQVKELDGEIEELHNYASILEEGHRSKKLDLLALLGGLFLIPSFILAYYGIDSFEESAFLFGKANKPFTIIGVLSILGILTATLTQVWNKKSKNIWLLITCVFFILALLLPNIDLQQKDKPSPPAKHITQPEQPIITDPS